MAAPQAQFPLGGIIGIVDSSAAQVEQAVQSGLSCVEIRADLLQSAGLSNDTILALTQRAKIQGLACLFTLRHADQGGRFNASENDRVAFCTDALQSGADIIDLEHGTDAASLMLGQGAPMILSYHNFERMLEQTELSELGKAMEAQSPRAVKIIPTGQSISDAALMLNWVGGAGDAIKRIGFTMGADGACSRILTIACGAPITYASFGAPVAPGQVDINELLNRYHVMNMTTQSRVTALIGDKDQVQGYLSEQKSTKKIQPAEMVYLAFAAKDEQELSRLKDDLKLAQIINL